MKTRTDDKGRLIVGEWLKAFDEKRNLHYFWNTRTHESTWTEPEVFKLALAGPVVNGLPSGWSEQVDPATGQTYYWNSVEEVPQWDKPTSKPRIPDGWVQKLDPATNRFYFWNEASKLSTWFFPTSY